MPTGLKEPQLTLAFALEIQGKKVQLFTSVGGLDATVEVVRERLQDAKGADVYVALPAQITYGDLTLSRKISDDLEIYNWHKEVLDGKIEKARTACSVVLFGQDGKETLRWNLTEAWPSKVSYSEMDATAGATVNEELTIVYEHLERVK
jgi:phage tail-like protein